MVTLYTVIGSQVHHSVKHYQKLSVGDVLCSHWSSNPSLCKALPKGAVTSSSGLVPVNSSRCLGVCHCSQLKIRHLPAAAAVADATLVYGRLSDFLQKSSEAPFVQNRRLGTHAGCGARTRPQNNTCQGFVKGFFDNSHI